MRGILRRVRPDHGGRLELKLVEATESSAHYALVIFTPSAEVSASVQVNAHTEAVAFGAWTESAPPAWLEAFSRTLLRSVLRTKASDGEWPRRLTRWRPEPTPRGSDPTQ